MKISTEMRSKLLDGLSTPFVVFMLILMLVLLVRPLEVLVGRSGLFIYALSLLAMAILCLDRSVCKESGEIKQALSGIASGAIAWIVTQLSNYIGAFAVDSVTGGLIFLMVMLIAFTLRKRGLPLGLQFFAATFLINWAAYLIVIGLRLFSMWVPLIEMSLNIIGYVFIGLSFVVSAMILFRQSGRIERLWAALVVYFFLIMTLYVFQGKIL
jgi:hypothetical protein